jgi:sec-independent protein translocase protein TatB
VFGIGWTELIVIVLVLLVFVGPRNLPPLLRKVGGIMAELKAASRDLRNQIEVEVKELDINPKQMARQIEKDLLKEVSDPYEEMRRADREIRDGLGETRREVTALSATDEGGRVVEPADAKRDEGRAEDAGSREPGEGEAEEQ